MVKKYSQCVTMLNIFYNITHGYRTSATTRQVVLEVKADTHYYTNDTALVKGIEMLYTRPIRP